MPSIKKERNYGIDLLRLVLMFMVCMLHTLLQGGILGACKDGSTEHKVFWFLETFSYCAVDGFAIISGYMATNKPRKFSKLADMWFQAFFYSFVITVILILAGVGKGYGKGAIITSALPVSFKSFWYFTAFFIAFFAMPVLNKFIFSIDKANAQKAMIVLGILFSGISIIAGDPFNLNDGYSALWIIALYLFGALAKKAELFESRKSITLILIWMLCIVLSWAFYMFLGTSRLISYVSPTILLSGMIMVILFSRIKLKGTVISKLSPLAFGIYLFQNNTVIWNFVIKNAFAPVASKNIIISVLLVFACASLIFISGLIVEFIRSKLAKALKISVLSEKIILLFDFLLNKLSLLLK